MNATLTELHRNTSEVMEPVLNGGKSIILTNHGKPVAEIKPRKPIDRQKLIAALRALGPIELPARQ